MRLCICFTVLAFSYLHIASARPTKTKRTAAPWGSDWFGNGDSEISGGNAWLSQCSNFDISKAQLPTGAPTPLPSPTGTLSHVAIGRGVQNYTCDMSDPEATPVPVGALATLYDASCVAAINPTLLAYLPDIAYSIRLPTLPDFFSQGDSSSSATSSSSMESNFFSAIASSTPVDLVLNAADSLMLGHHFFLDDTTPRFDLDTSNGNYGCITATKIAESDAPAGSADRSVAWLYLTKSESYVASAQSYSEVYRVNTVGGAAPSTCQEARKPHFRVQYSAEYWFYV